MNYRNSFSSWSEDYMADMIIGQGWRRICFDQMSIGDWFRMGSMLQLHMQLKNNWSLQRRENWRIWNPRITYSSPMNVRSWKSFSCATPQKIFGMLYATSITALQSINGCTCSLWVESLRFLQLDKMKKFMSTLRECLLLPIEW